MKSTELDKEIQEGLYDPRKSQGYDPEKIWYAGQTLTGLDFSNKIEFPSKAAAMRFIKPKKKDASGRIWIVRSRTYDPKAATRQITAKEWNTKKKHGYTLIKNGQKYILTMDKGKTILEPVKVYDPKQYSQRFFNETIRQWTNQYIESGKKPLNAQKLALKRYVRIYGKTTYPLPSLSLEATRHLDPKQFMVVKDPYSNPNVKHAWNKNSLYFRLQYLPHLREWWLRLDEIIKGKDTILREWNVGKGLKSEKRAIRKVEEIMRTYDPKKQSHVYKVGWKAKTGFKVKSFWTKAEMDKQVAILKKAGIWHRAWQAGTDKVYDPKASLLPPTRWYEAMVRGIKKSSDVGNPYAIVKSIWAKLSPAKKAEFRAREKKREHFKYDLPLPVDKPTRGTGTVRMVKPFKLAEVQVNLSVKDYLAARASGLFQRMKREDGTTALVARCKSPQKNVNVFVDKVGAKQ